MTWTYPKDDLDNPRKTLSLLGSLWTNTYAGVDFLQARVGARNAIARQANDDLLQAGELISRIEMPIWHTYNWYAMYVNSTDMSETAAAWYFDDPALPAFDAAPGFTFDHSMITGAVGTAAPTDLSDVLIITNRITDPSVVLHRDIDFVVSSEGMLVFRENPFDDVLFSKTSTFVDGSVAAQQMILWLCRPAFDWDLVYNHFGYVLGLQLTSSEGYKFLVNHVLDACVRGTAQVDVTRLIAAIYGIPLVLEATETVEDIWSDSRHLLVVTDQHVYEHRLGATVIVAVGDTVYRGQPLIDAFVAYDLRSGDDFPDIAAIALPMGFLSPIFGGEIAWENAAVPVVVTGVAGAERVEWQLSGSVSDLALFWDTVHQRRLVYGDSLYELLAAYYGTVPATINPMEFLVTHVLRNNCMVIVVNSSGVGEDRINTAVEPWLRKILPPHTAIIVIVEMSSLSGSVTMGSGDPSSGLGAEPLSGEIGWIGGTLNIW
jgi:hypothetical protein